MSRLRSSLLVVAATVTVSHADKPAGLDASIIHVFSIGHVGTASGADDQPPRADTSASSGSGFIVGDGLVMTAAHVIIGRKLIALQVPGHERAVPASIVYSDPDDDVAVLAYPVDRRARPLAIEQRRTPAVREAVFAVGYPVDPARKSPVSARGIIAGRLDNGTIQLDMNLNGGNSGGPLVDHRDRVIGMVVARGDVQHGVQGIGYAVPPAKLAAALAAARRRIARGVTTDADIDDITARQITDLLQRGTITPSLAKLVDDPDLLAYIGGTLWNIAQSDGRDSYATAGLHSCVRAAQLDPEIADRSPFVSQVIAWAEREEQRRDAPAVSAPATHAEPAEVKPAPHLDAVASAPVRSQARWQLAIRAAAAARWDPAAAGIAAGYGGDVEIQRQTAGRLVLGIAVGTGLATASPMQADPASHWYYVAELSVGLGLGDRRQLQLVAATGPARFGVRLGNGAAADNWAWTARAGLTYQYRRIQLGTGARAFPSGNLPTLWLEPVSLGVVF